MSTISFSLAKPGKAMPGPYHSLMVLRRRASRSGAGQAVRGRKTRDSADGALIRLLTSNKAYRTRRDAARAVGTRDFVRSACSRRDRVPHYLPNHSYRRVLLFSGQQAEHGKKTGKTRKYPRGFPGIFGYYPHWTLEIVVGHCQAFLIVVQPA